VRRVGIAGIWQETNTYSSRATTLREFEDFELLSGDEILERHQGTRSVIGGMLDAGGFDLAPVFTAGAWPGAPADRTTLDTLHERLTAALERSGPLDGVLLNLHGAMVCDGVDDAELETVRTIRATVGDVPMAAVLDLHGNPSPEMVATCGIVVSYDTYPHVDMHERGYEAAVLLTETFEGDDLATVEEHESLARAAQQMYDRRVGSVLVLDA
jgi:microcystin degradation protein MlrC